MGDGLHFDGGCQLDVRSLEIRNFPGHGIEARQTAEFHQCYTAGGYGLYLQKTWLAHNERGIVAKGIETSLKENVIHDASTSLSRYGYPEAETWLGAMHVLQDRKIELRVPGDLRGQWITGTITRSQTLYFLSDEGRPRSDVYRPSGGHDTSELSDPVQVH